MTIRERVIELCKERKMTQSELSKALNAPKTTVNGWFLNDKRNPSSEYILPICNFFDVDVEWLLSGEKGCQKIKCEAHADLIRWYDDCDTRGKDAIKQVCLNESMRSKREKEILIEA